MITFTAHTPNENETTNVAEALASGITEGDGPFTARATERLETLFDGARVLLTPSCTAALELSALLCDVQPGDEIVMPSYTFVSTANAFRLRGAKIRFADIDAETFGMGTAEVDAAVTPKTKGVCAVHYGGVAPYAKTLKALCTDRDMYLVEDNAHGLFAKSDGQTLGTFGRFSTVSFHRTKNISCGEGGALIINDEADFHRAEMLREKGTDRSRFIRGEVDKYTWRDIGSSYLLSDILAAVLLAQLDHAEKTQAIRQALWTQYDDALRGVLAANGGHAQKIDDAVTHPAHVFAFAIPPDRNRRELFAALKAAGVQGTSHYEPLHVAPAHTGDEALPVTEDIAKRLARLPLHASMRASDADAAITVVTKWLEQ